MQSTPHVFDESMLEAARMLRDNSGNPQSAMVVPQQSANVISQQSARIAPQKGDMQLDDAYRTSLIGKAVEQILKQYDTYMGPLDVKNGMGKERIYEDGSSEFVPQTNDLFYRKRFGAPLRRT